MAIPKFLEDIAFISKLGDNPRTDNGLSEEEFKGMFDKAALLLQSYINNTLIPMLNQIVDVEALLTELLDSTLTQENKAAPAKTVSDKLAEKLDKTGGNLTGAVDMGSNKITNLALPEESGDAASKSYVDSRHLFMEVNVPASGWAGNAAPYTQTISLSGVLATDRPVYDVLLTGDNAAKEAQKEAFGYVDDLETAAGSIVLTCLEGKPDVDLVIQMEVNR